VTKPRARGPTTAELDARITAMETKLDRIETMLWRILIGVGVTAGGTTVAGVAAAVVGP
jgi:hypothetical protein